MGKEPEIWKAWLSFLRRWGMQEIAAFLLEATGPLNLLSAQIVHITHPFLSLLASNDHLDALTEMFENQSKQKAFLSYLRQSETM